MNFDKLLATFDMGVCADQVQREAVFDLVIFFAAVDGMESDEEISFIDNWMDEAPWNCKISIEDFRVAARKRVTDAMKCGHYEGFIKQRAAVLVNTPAKDDTIELIEQLISIDGDVHDTERECFEYLQKLLR